MKILCECGEVIRDNTDGLTFKASYVADEDWNELWELVESSLEKAAGPDARPVHHVMSEFSRFFEWMWQCRACGRLFLTDDTNKTDSHVFTFKQSGDKDFDADVENEF